MPHLLIHWNDFVVEKVNQHGLTVEQVEAAVYKAKTKNLRVSRSTGRPLYDVQTPQGEPIIVVFEWLDPASIRIVTAYPKD